MAVRAHAKPAWPKIPPDVIDWFRSIFRTANTDVTTLLDNQPNIRETSLDDHLILALQRNAAPTILPSGTIVSMRIHNIGGLRRYGSWEVADIAFIVWVRDPTGGIYQKIGMLQSKRLFPDNFDVDDEDAYGFLVGMNGLIYPDPSFISRSTHKTFQFSEQSIYGSYDPVQLKRIRSFNRQFGEATYYLFYNPSRLPLTTHFPKPGSTTPAVVDVGSRVSTTYEILRAAGGYKPTKLSRQNVQLAAKRSDWPLEHWAADLLLKCKVGKQYDRSLTERVESLLYRRSGPIAAVVQTTIEIGEGAIE
jgi:hypothetical protein